MKAPYKAFTAAIENVGNVLICMKGSPDPDALASAVTVKTLCETLGKQARVAATQKLSLKQNEMFVRQLGLAFDVVSSFEKHARWADAYIVVDHPSPAVDGLSDAVPCCVHIDHHEKIRSSVRPTMRWCTMKAGSTSTLVAQLLEHSHRANNLPESEMQRLATALLFGLQTDTDEYALATDADYAAVDFLSRFADTAVLERLSGVPLSRSTAGRLQIAEQHQEVYKAWLMTGIGFVPASNRDEIAIIADLLLRREDAETVIVFAIIEDAKKQTLTLDASIRTRNQALKLNPLIRRLASNGGGRKSKGAFQVELDYFANFADRDLLWDVIEKATLEKLKRTRDVTYRVKLEGMVVKARGASADLYANIAGAFRHARRRASRTLSKLGR